MRAAGPRAALAAALVLCASPAAAQRRPREPLPSELSSKDTRALEQLDEAGRAALELAVRERFAAIAPAVDADRRGYQGIAFGDVLMRGRGRAAGSRGAAARGGVPRA